MKKLLTIFLVAALVLTLAVGISADEQVIKMGTAVIDGVLDEAYKHSFSLLGIGKQGNTGPYIDKWNYTAYFDLYLMYDTTNLYLCAVVTDDDVLTMGEEYATGYNPTNNEVIEFKLSMDGTTENIFKVAVDAYGYQLFGLDAHYDIIDYSSMKYTTKITDTGYVVEVSIPCTKGDLDMIETGKLGILWNIKDMDINAEVGRTNNFYSSFPASSDNENDPVYYNLSSEEALPGSSTVTPPTQDTTAKQEDTTAKQEDTTAKQEDTTAKQEDTTAKQEDTTAPIEDTTPSTFDPIVIVAVITAASGAAFVVASKKR